jgi:K+-sensing histidine kinase KdpD
MPGSVQVPATTFRAFTSDASHAATPRDGTGLGLAIARGLVRAHGGEIEVRGTADAGRCFVVSMPHAPSA